ncbi:MAG: hypothetical protein OXQ29_19920 [Rhodospirillaceae bacterium]|nr:hypothetical protein [Rhodospirillaceae bacterium]
MIIEAVTITESGTHEWPWNHGGLIVVVGGSGGEGGRGSSNHGGLGGSGGQGSGVVVEGHGITVRGGNGGEGGQATGHGGNVGSKGWPGKPGETKTAYVFPAGADGKNLRVNIGAGGTGGTGREITASGAKELDGFYQGEDGDSGKVVLIPLPNVVMP